MPAFDKDSDEMVGAQVIVGGEAEIRKQSASGCLTGRADEVEVVSVHAAQGSDRWDTCRWGG